MIRFRLKRARWALALVATLAGGGSFGFAFIPGACQKDAEKLCPGLTGKELTPCLQKQQLNLSMECRTNLAEAREMVRETRDACESDVEKFCAKVEPGKGRIVKCLKEHQSELSAGCQTSLAATKQKIMPDPQAGAPAN